MANVGTFKLTGINQLEKRLLKLEQVASSKGPAGRSLNASVRSGLNPIKKQFKANSYNRVKSGSTGNLQKSIKVKTAKLKSKSDFMAILGYAEKPRRYKDKAKFNASGYADGYYGAFIEKHTKHHNQFVANFALTKAFESQKRNALKRTLDMLSKRLNAEFKKLSVK